MEPGLRVDVSPVYMKDPPKRTIGNVLEPSMFAQSDISCAPLPPRGGGEPQKGGRIQQQDEPLVERAVREGESAFEGVRTALNRMAPANATRVLEIKNEILRRLVNEDIDARMGANNQSLLANYIQTFQITSSIINSRGEGGTTVLMHAAVTGRWKSVQLLASPELGADPNIQNDAGETALMWAAAYNELSAVRELKKDPNLNYNLVDNLGWSALMVAAWCGHDVVVQQLAQYTDTNHVTADGRNAAKLVMDENSPARIRGVSNKVLAMLGRRGHPQKGGRNRTPRRSKTKSKKRGTR
jgi:hypothetical protein